MENIIQDNKSYLQIIQRQNQNFFLQKALFLWKNTLVPHQENVPTYLLCNYETCYALNEQNYSIEPVHDNE